MIGLKYKGSIFLALSLPLNEMFIRRLVVSIPTRNGRERLQLSHYLYTSLRKVIGAQ